MKRITTAYNPDEKAEVRQVRVKVVKPDEKDLEKRQAMVKTETSRTAEANLVAYYRVLDKEKQEKLLTYAEFLAKPKAAEADSNQ